MSLSRRQWLSYLMLAGLCGCNSSPLGKLSFFDSEKSATRAQSPDEEDADDPDEFKTKVQTPMVGEYTTVTGRNLVVLQGVGLVTGLNGTGGDPHPSPERTALLEDMKRRGVPQPNKILLDRSTALVVVRAYLPPLVKQGDRFDVYVRMPGNAEGTSLNGGWLMETYLSEAQNIPGKGVLKGHVFAKAQGSILISSGEGNKESMSAVLRRGRVLGGGVSLKDRDMALYLRNDFRSVRNADRIAKCVGLRFFDYDKHGIKEPLAKAVTDQKVELKILRRYKDNFPRYLQAIRKIAFRETEQARYVRMQQLKDKLNNPPTSENAAIELEAIGSEAVPILKAGLNGPTLETQFHSAVSLAYLGQSDGIPVLAKAVREEQAFRVFGLAAMSVCEDAGAALELQKLLDEPSAETRYGAFRALTTMDKNHPYVRGQNMRDEFMMHVLETSGPPMIHLTTRQKAELVLFGAHQAITTPVAIQAGDHIRITGQTGSETVTISRYQLGKPDRRKVVSTDLAEIIRTIASDEFGASYPDVAQMLFQASKQKNLATRLEIDALPASGRMYVRPQAGESGKKKSKSKVGNSNDTPNLFEPGKHEEEGDRKGPTAVTTASAKDSKDSKDSSKSKATSQPHANVSDTKLEGVRTPEANDDEHPNAFQRARSGFMRMIGQDNEYAKARESSDE